MDAYYMLDRQLLNFMQQVLEAAKAPISSLSTRTTLTSPMTSLQGRPTRSAPLMHLATWQQRQQLK
jgi:hypothetical protein